MKPFEDVGDIKIASTKVQVLLEDFEINKYTPTIPIAKITEFTKYLVQKKESRTKTKQYIELLHKTFVVLTKTSLKSS